MMEKSQFSPLIERFLTYVRFDTQSAEGSSETPSTEKQLRLAERLVEDLEMLGAKEARIGHGGVVYAEIPATTGAEDALPIGMIAHMDTSPDAPGENVQPQIIRYEGGDVLLNQKAGITFRADDFPEIRKYAGEEIIFTDGTTLLGADDKAGIAAIMGMCEHLRNHPEIPHARICIGFTPDEEVARGTENFDIPLFGAAYAYTFDGGEIGTLESENFNAATAVVKIHGVGVHPGSAKNKMVNSIRLMAKFIDMLPADMSPEATCGHEGFLHPNNIDGSVVESTVRILIRDHDPARFEEKKAFLRDAVAKLNALFPKANAELVIRDSYENMRTYLDRVPRVLEIARQAYRAAGLEPIEEPIRGGTDGARLTVRGLPCPNIFTGGMNFHGIYECIPVKSLEKAAEVAVRLAELSAKVKSLA